MPRPKKHKPLPPWCVDGAPVYYQPIVIRGEPRYAGTVDGDPYQLGDGSWVAHLRDMDPAYEYAAKHGHRVRCAGVFAMTERKP
jgi:hypothetical protein